MICLAFTDFTLNSFDAFVAGGDAAATELRTVNGRDLNEGGIEVEVGGNNIEDDSDLGLVEKKGFESGVEAKAIEMASF